MAFFGECFFLCAAERRFLAFLSTVVSVMLRARTCITSVGGALSPRTGSGVNEGDRTAPSSRQKLSVSSKVRLQLGQLFIEILKDAGLKGGQRFHQPYMHAIQFPFAHCFAGANNGSGK